MSKEPCEEKKMQKNKIDILFRYDYLVCGILTVIMMLVIFIGADLINGGNKAFMTNSDTMTQMVAFGNMFIRHLFQGENIFYSMETSMGQNTSLLYAYYAYNPFNLFYFFIKDSYYATVAILIGKTALAAICFNLFLKYVSKKSTAWKITFSLLYAFCSFQFEYMCCANLMDALYLLPVVALCLYRAMKTGKFTYLCIAYLASFIINFYCGFLIGLFSLVFIPVIWYLKPELRMHMLRFLGKYVFCVMTAVCISMLVLLPAILFVIESKGGNDLKVRYIPGIIELLFSVYAGRDSFLDAHLPYLYCGIPVLVFLPLYFFDDTFPKKERFLMLGVAGSFLLTVWSDGIYYFLHVFNRPDGYNYRYIFMYVFWAVFLAWREVVDGKLCHKNTRAVKLYIVGQFVLCIIILVLYKRFGVEENLGRVKELLVLNLVLYFLWGGITLYGKKGAGILVILGGVFEICAAGLYTVKNTENSDRSMLREKKTIINAIANEIQTFSKGYRMHLSDEFSVNQGAESGYMGIGQFSTANYKELIKLMNLIGDGISDAEYNQHGATDLTDMCFAVRYRGKSTDFELNKRALQVGYAASPYILLENDGFRGNVFENQNYLLSCLCGEAMEAYVKADVYGLDTNDLSCDKTAAGYEIRTTNAEKRGEALFGIPAQDYEHAYFYFQMTAPEREAVEKMVTDEMATDISLFSTGDRKTSGERNQIVYHNAIMEMTKENDQFLILLADFETPEKSFSYYDQLFYYQDENVLNRAAEILKQGEWAVEKWQNGHIEADFTATEEKPVLFITLPYDKGWHAYVDGKEVQVYAVVQNAFMAIPMEVGNHQITLDFEAPGTDLGRIVFGVGVIMLLMLFLSDRKGMADVNRKE